MPTYEVFLQEYKETPRVKIVAKNQEEALAAYKDLGDKGKLAGDFIKKFTWQAMEIWRINK